MTIDTISETACFGGVQGVYRHHSPSTNTDMEFALFLPPQAKDGPVPLLVFLSGLTCTWENVTTKAAAQRACSKAGIAFLAPDTSPRGEGVPDDDAYDLGQGAGFYINATQQPWAAHYHMEDYIIKDLLPLILNHFAVKPDHVGLTGHSMGGHGALTLAMKYPRHFVSLSAFAPITNPSATPWGQKAFSAYLGDDQRLWNNHDACTLIKTKGWHSKILIDIGLDDPFLNQELTPDRFQSASEDCGVSVTLRKHLGYDHSYYFIMSFIKDHISWFQSVSTLKTT